MLSIGSSLVCKLMATRGRSLVAVFFTITGLKKPHSQEGGKEQGKFSVPLKEGKAKAAELFN
jgi:hypothetical protein